MGEINNLWFIIMNRRTLFIALISMCSSAWAAKIIYLHQAPESRLQQFAPLQQPRSVSSSPSKPTDLKALTQTQQNNEIITRYQQQYQGLPIVGAQVTVSHNAKSRGLASGQVNGHLFDDIHLNTQPSITSAQAIELAQHTFLNANPQLKTDHNMAHLEIRTDKNNELQLVYLVSFKSVSQDNKLLWPFFVINAQTGSITKEWDNVKHFSDSGPGGNERVNEYWYGQDGLPSLEVAQTGDICTLADTKVSLINLKGEWDWYGIARAPSTYTCKNNTEDLVHGAYSAGNDAYYFGHVIVDLFHNWYGMNALQDDAGNPQQLIMRVHFGQHYDNAFWDEETQTMAFGDGDQFYPLVSLDVAGHEVAHGFTQRHANLEYHDQSGALNESFSDMAGQASRAYLLETTPQLYNKAYLTPNQLTWGLGETIIPASLSLKAIRFIDLPSLDGESADCVDKAMARTHQSLCAISYSELLDNAEYQFPDPSGQANKQSYIVHTASGVFNRAFYLMSKDLGVKTAFHVMLIANVKYWTPTTEFNEAACGVLAAANDLKIDTRIIQSSFSKVGIDLTPCNH